MLQWLSQLPDLFQALNVFRYITFRTGGAIVTTRLFVGASSSANGPGSYSILVDYFRPMRVPLVFALLHAVQVLPIEFLQRLDDVLYDARLRATMPRTMDDRIVIVDHEHRLRQFLHGEVST